MLKSEDDVVSVTLDVSVAELADAGHPSAASSAQFVRTLVTRLRKHPHLNNVLTHIARGRWDRIEAALMTIFSAPNSPASLSPLARNLVDLLWAERGVTGRIAKPFFLDLCASMPQETADYWTNCVKGYEAKMAAERHAQTLAIERAALIEGSTALTFAPPAGLSHDRQPL